MPNKYMDSEDEDNFYNGLAQFARESRNAAIKSVIAAFIAMLVTVINIWVVIIYWR